ncbi:MAG: Rap1a/Tai family immunity protein [Pseudomonadota bacterium]
MRAEGGQLRLGLRADRLVPGRQRAFCNGYIAALVDYQDELQRAAAVTPRFCLRPDTKLSDLHDLALERLRANPPSELRKLAASLVIPALIREFGCR